MASKKSDAPTRPVHIRMASIAPPIVGRRRKSLLKISFFIVAFIFLSKFSCGISHLTDSVNPFFWFSEQPVGKGKNRDSNLFMTEGQCRSAFPGLMNEIDLAVGRESERAKREGNNDGRSGLEKQPDDYTGLIEGRIKDGKLYVMSSEWRPSRMMLHERQAALHQLYRAIITSPTPLPDTIFSLSILDNPRKGSWSYSRTNDPKIQGNYWLMPHFSHWSWPKPFIGTMDTALTRISEVEKNNPWEKKIDKAVWRGTAWFNGVGNTALRPNLLREAKGKEWADVEDMQWQTNAVTASNSIEISDFCKYKYIIYTEGITYSGRLPFHQACASIILTPPPNYQMHTTHLMNPLFSYTLPFSPSFNAQKTPNGNPRWAKAYPPSEANVVFVEPDWSDLEQTINYLRKHDNVARGIAERQRETYIGGGYATEAAEVCYWRSLVRGWASVVKPKMGEWNETGIRWETFSLIGETRWDRAQ